MLGLRLTEGISLSKYKELFNINLEEYKKNEIEKLEKQRLIKILGDNLVTTQKGMLLLNQVILDLI
jgi:oxygen-independent coproporphyrinogen-3 oxidase